MNDFHSPSASQVLRDATDDLAVDTDRLVRGGIARGRTIRRRRRVGTTLAAAAVVGVIGVAASVGPGLLGGDATGGDGPGFAAGTTATSGPPASPPTTAARFEPAPRQPDAAIKIGAELVPTIIGEKVGGDGEVGEPLTDEPYGFVDEPERKIVHFLYDGTLTTFSIERADTLATCGEMVDPADQPDGRPGGECVVVDGLETLSWGPDTADGVTGQGVMAWQHGWVVSALSYNAADGKDVPVVTDVPPISPDDLLALTTADFWFDLEGAELTGS